MLRVSAKKTRWAHNAYAFATIRFMKRAFIFGVYGILVTLGAVFAVYVSADSPFVSLGGKEYVAEIADTDEKRQQGLSDRHALPQNEAMLFVFNGAEQRCFWMKDMHFAIDIVWVDKRQRVAHIERNVSPGTYPSSYCPDVPARYVVETSAGATKDVRLGDVVYIQY